MHALSCQHWLLFPKVLSVLASWRALVAVRAFFFRVRIPPAVPMTLVATIADGTHRKLADHAGRGVRGILPCIFKSVYTECLPDLKAGWGGMHARVGVCALADSCVLALVRQPTDSCVLALVCRACRHNPTDKQAGTNGRFVEVAMILFLFLSCIYPCSSFFLRDIRVCVCERDPFL